MEKKQCWHTNLLPFGQYLVEAAVEYTIHFVSGRSPHRAVVVIGEWRASGGVGWRLGMQRIRLSLGPFN
jgi:hypothetical protein